MKKTLSIILLPLCMVYLFAITGCNKNNTTGVVPTLVTTTATINANATTGQAGGLLTAYNDTYLTAAGVCYSSTNKTPTTADSHTSDTLKISSFTSNLTGLTANTVYYVRAYATNTFGTGYGDVIQVNTGVNLTAKVGTVSTFAGSGAGGFVDATGLNAQFNNPQGITIDGQGNLYVADAFNSSIRKITPTGVVNTYTGNGTLGYVDGTLANARFYASSDVAFDATNNILYVSDYGNNLIRKITAAGVVSTFAGDGSKGYVDGTGTAAEFSSPRGLAVDAAGNVYVADRGNSTIRKITTAGVVTTIAGSRTSSYYDAAGTLAAFNRPTGVAVDATGNIYVADALNYSIRKIALDGTVTTILGSPLHKNIVGTPAALAIDKQGNLYISDQSGSIMKLSTDMRLTTLAGAMNTSGFTNATGAGALFNAPQGLTLDATGNIYVADYNNNVIRKIVQP